MDDSNNPGSGSGADRDSYPAREAGNSAPGSFSPQGGPTDSDAGMTRRMDNLPPAAQPPSYGAPPVSPPGYGAPGQPGPGPGSSYQYTPPSGPPTAGAAPQYTAPNMYTPGNVNRPTAAIGGITMAPVVADPNVLMVIEIIAGIFGFMGVGHILSGRVIQGIVLMVAWWVVAGLSWILILPLLLVTCGLGICLLPFIWWAPPILSALWLRSQMTGRSMFSR
ncbi:MAG TPA: hypothetical protein VM536_22015 [Chloroflexia bacterium]|nr:hypothetical protein [Chloroflexia bacterium]